ncbi:hypothetical protein BDZ91DRAFT_417425 [Kalaharituber pfeilii]|nr:hypothetical protein BDZ91DRAFT_417425 [Kalaharituber pfeilii]
MTAMYTTPTHNGTTPAVNSTSPRHHQALQISRQFPTSSQSHPPAHQQHYGLSPVQQYARIIYEHTRQQMDNAAAAQSQRDSYSIRHQSSHNQQSGRGYNEGSRATMRT